jgi:hypothetical protein
MENEGMGELINEQYCWELPNETQRRKKVKLLTKIRKNFS